VNYRTTEQIRRFADQLLPSSLDQGDGELEMRETVSLLSGLPPRVQGAATVGEEVRGVTSYLKTVLNAGYQPSDIAIFARTERVLRERAEAALRSYGLGWQYLSDDEPPSRDTVALGTMYRAKGLEFKVVIVMGCDADLLPLAFALREFTDEADRQGFTEQERNLFYVACTRAREQLLLTYTGVPSPFLETVSFVAGQGTS
jgi:superfamily I DNA/RNA helicase